MKDDASQLTKLLAQTNPQVRELFLKARELVRQNLPDAIEEISLPIKLLGFTFIPGTYKGMPVALMLHGGYVNIMFSKGVELMPLDTAHLLEGTGKQARHIKITTLNQLDHKTIPALLRMAAARTPRAKEH